MFSITKNRQDAATLRRMIERAYGPEQVPVGDDFAHEFTHGWFNAAGIRTRSARSSPNTATRSTRSRSRG